MLAHHSDEAGESRRGEEGGAERGARDSTLSTSADIGWAVDSAWCKMCHEGLLIDDVRTHRDGVL